MVQKNKTPYINNTIHFEGSRCNILFLAETFECSPETNAQQKNHKKSGQAHIFSIDDLNASLLERMQPDVVISTLISKSFDAYDVSARLHALKYHGTYQIAPVGPCDSALIERELSKVAPKVDISISKNISYLV